MERLAVSRAVFYAESVFFFQQADRVLIYFFYSAALRRVPFGYRIPEKRYLSEIPHLQDLRNFKFKIVYRRR